MESLRARAPRIGGSPPDAGQREVHPRLLTELNDLFRGHVIAIVGVGGTDSYILDQVAKTWVDRIIVINGDVLENHNAFRAPGAVALETLLAMSTQPGPAVMPGPG